MTTKTQTLTAATWAAEILARACLAHHRACCVASDRLPSPFAAGDGSEAARAREEAEMQHAADAADAESDEYEREQAGYLAQIGDSAQQAWIVAQIQQQPECRAAAEAVLRAEGVDSLEVFAFGAFEGPRPSVRLDSRAWVTPPHDGVSHGREAARNRGRMGR